MAPLKDLTGQQFGQLTVVNQVPNPDFAGGAWWKCRCSCGRMLNIRSFSLRSGNTRSCGCLRRAQLAERNTIHGLSHTREHNIWRKIVARCTSPTRKDFPRYGGRGITICPEWRHSFATFYADMGPRPSLKHSVERRDNDGPYSPENCHWATWSEQCLNKRNNRRVEWNGSTKPLMEWSRILAIPYNVLRKRLDRHWSVSRAFTTSYAPAITQAHSGR